MSLCHLSVRKFDALEESSSKSCARTIVLRKANFPPSSTAFHSTKLCLKACGAIGRVKQLLQQLHSVGRSSSAVCDQGLASHASRRIGCTETTTVAFSLSSDNFWALK